MFLRQADLDLREGCEEEGRFFEEGSTETLEDEAAEEEVRGAIMR